MKTSTLASLAAALMITTVALPAFAAQPTGKGDGPRGGHHGPRIERLLEEFDADGNGSVTLAEIETHRSDMFASIDADNSGSLSEEEFGMLRQMREAKREAARAEMKAGNDGREEGKKLGRDHRKGHEGKRHGMDGKHAGRHGGKGEGKAGRHGEGPTLAKFDSDKNGSISLAEFSASAPKMFKHFDRNDDGVINADDFNRKRADAN